MQYIKCNSQGKNSSNTQDRMRRKLAQAEYINQSWTAEDKYQRRQEAKRARRKRAKANKRAA